MPNYIKQFGAYIGFGLTQEEAENDAYINSCIISLSNDTKELFSKRRLELHPWMPQSNMLHISGVGCLTYKDLFIEESASGKRVCVAATGGSIYYYLSQLFGSKLSYTDISVVAREEFDRFFRNISTDFVPIKDMSVIQCQQEHTGFRTSVVYNTDYGFHIGCTNDAVGIKFIGEDSYYIAQGVKAQDQLAAVHRLLYRTGNILNGSNLEEIAND